MNTFIDGSCKDIKKVIVQFTSLEGKVDYELIYRGQSYFALEKRLDEIIDLSLFSEGTFIGYDADEKIIAVTPVIIE